MQYAVFTVYCIVYTLYSVCCIHYTLQCMLYACVIMHRTKNSLSKPKTPRAKDNGNLANISVPYYPALSKPLRQISDRHNISLTFTSSRNLFNMLTKTKTQPPPHTTRNVIHQIPCKDCNATYCGQTRRPLH